MSAAKRMQDETVTRLMKQSVPNPAPANTPHHAGPQGTPNRRSDGIRPTIKPLPITTKR